MKRLLYTLPFFALSLALVSGSFAAEEKPLQRGQAAVMLGATHYQIRNVEFKDAASCKAMCEFLQKEHPNGAAVLTRFDRFADLFISCTSKPNGIYIDENGQKAMAALRNREMGWVWDEPNGLAEAPEPPEVVPTGGVRGKAEEIVRGGCEGLTGEGVIVAIIDSGIDFYNPDFITEDGKTSRVLYYWDTLAKGPRLAGTPGGDPPFYYPNKAPIGVLYSRDDLTKALTDTRRRLSPDVIAKVGDFWDGGHGTGCATIAAGNGRKQVKDKFVGVAPKADIIAVRIGELEGMNNGWLLPAICGWLDEVAQKEKKQLVVSCSFGRSSGGHDGSFIEERQLDARWPLTARGRTLCISAGNDGYQPIHAELNVDADKPAELKWLAPSANGWLELYLGTKDSTGVTFAGTASDDIKEGLYLHPLAEELRVRVSVPKGEGKLTITSKKPVAIDAYVFSHTEDGRPNSTFISPKPSPSKLIGSPACTPNAITVGSYDWNATFNGQNYQVKFGRGSNEYRDMRLGALSAYSSPGPFRRNPNKIIKPDIVAPGQWFTVNMPATRIGTPPAVRRFNGTSSATPYVAGVVTLMFEANKPMFDSGKGLTLGDVKALLAKHARSDDETELAGKLPNAKWGNGKLNYDAVVAILKEIKEMARQNPK